MPKFDPILKVRAAANNEDGDSTTKAVPGPALPVKKETSPRISCNDQPTKQVLKEFYEIHALLKPDLLEEMEACPKFVYGVSKVVNSSFFAKCEAQSRRVSLLAMM